MSVYPKHVFVCTYGKSCPEVGSDDVLSALRLAVKQLPEGHCIRVNKSGCLGQCGCGPMVVIYPEGVWYAAVRPEDCPEIVESHLGHGTPVERLLYKAPIGCII